MSLFYGCHGLANRKETCYNAGEAAVVGVGLRFAGRAGAIFGRFVRGRTVQRLVFSDRTEKFWYSRQTGGAGMMFTGSYASPLGGMTMASDGTALTGLWFDGQKYFGSGFLREKKEKNLPIFDQTTRWLDLYFSGEVPDFTPLLSAAGTPFQKTVWAVLLTIPYGQTRTYGEIASVIAKERGIPRLSAQAVGGAVGHNPISLVIPCHRVIGANGRLTGYAGGLDKKEKLLSLEQNGKDWKILTKKI